MLPLSRSLHSRTIREFFSPVILQDISLSLIAESTRRSYAKHAGLLLRSYVDVIAAFIMANTVKECRTTRCPLLLLASLPLPVINFFTHPPPTFVSVFTAFFPRFLFAIFLRHGDVSGYINALYPILFSPITFTHIHTDTRIYRRTLISRSCYSIQSPHQAPIPKGKGGRSSSRRRSALLSRFIVYSQVVYFGCNVR